MFTLHLKVVGSLTLLFIPFQPRPHGETLLILFVFGILFFFCLSFESLSSRIFVCNFFQGFSLSGQHHSDIVIVFFRRPQSPLCFVFLSPSLTLCLVPSIPPSLYRMSTSGVGGGYVSDKTTCPVLHVERLSEWMGLAVCTP